MPSKKINRKKIKKTFSDFSLISSILILAVFCFIDLPVLKKAQDIKAQTPIIKQVTNASGTQEIEIIDRQEAKNAAKEIKQLKNKINKELNELEKISKKIEKMIGKQIYKKYGLDEDLLMARATEIKTSIALARKNYKDENFNEALKIIDSIKSMDPENIFNVYNGIRKAKEKIRIIKNKEVEEIIYNLLEDIISSANRGDFARANSALTEMEGELFRLADKYIKNKSYLSPEMKERFDEVELKILEKLNTNEKL